MFNSNSTTTHYAAKKRRRPQTKKDKDGTKPETKSNPSKRHRDRLNLELDNLAKLIPFSEEVINKLDKLSILRLAVSYLKNKSYHTIVKNDILQKAQALRENQLEYKNPSDSAINNMDGKLSLQAMNGFIVVVSQNNNIFYVSESIQNLLGFPQCDVINSSMMDLIHADDRHIFTKNMKVDQTSSSLDGDKPEYTALGIPVEVFRELSNRGMMHRSFVCRLRCLTDNSSGFLALHFTGHIRLLPGQKRKTEGSKDPYQPELALFLLATVIETPSILEIRTKNFIFRTKHKLDYTPLGIDAKGRVVLGYTEYQLRQRSGYEFIHSADMMHCADAHTKLMRRGESGMTVFRILHKENKWLWVTASAKLVCRNGRPEYIVSTHRPIPDQEGHEHMNKRNVQFRFNFTGQAVLYGEVNPVGTKPSRPPPQDEPVEQQQQNSNSSSLTSSPLNQPQPREEKIPQQQPIGDGYTKSQPQNSYDKPSLFDAQTMQSEKIYTEETQKASIFDDIYQSVTTGMMPVDPGNKDLMSLESNDFGTCYYNIGQTYYDDTVFNDPDIDTILPPSLDSTFHDIKDLNGGGGNKWSSFREQERIFPMCSAPIKQYPVTEAQVTAVPPPEPGFHPPQLTNRNDHNSQQRLPQQTKDQGYSSSPDMYMQISPKTTGSVSSSGSIKRPYPYGRSDSSASSAKMSPSEHAMLHDRQQWQQQDVNRTMYNPNNQQQQQQQQHKQQQQMYRDSWYTDQQTAGNKSTTSRHKTTTVVPTNMMTNHQVFNQMCNLQNNQTSGKSNAGGGSSSSHFPPLNMPASSHFVMTQVEQRGGGSGSNGDFPNYSPPDAAWNDLELVDYQQSSTKFDLQEIAVRYQTADPMSKAHDYMRGEDSLYSGLKKGTLMNKGKLKNMNAQYTTNISKAAPIMHSNHSMLDSDSSPATMSISPCESMANGEVDPSGLLNGLGSSTTNHHPHHHVGYNTTQQMNNNNAAPLLTEGNFPPPLFTTDNPMTSSQDAANQQHMMMMMRRKDGHVTGSSSGSSSYQQQHQQQR